MILLTLCNWIALIVVSVGLARGWVELRGSRDDLAEVLGQDFRAAFLVVGTVLVLGLLNGVLPS